MEWYIQLYLFLEKMNNKFDLKNRKSIFYTFYNFARKIDIKLKSIVVDKRYSNTRLQLKKKLKDEMAKIIQHNYKYISSFKKVIVYYDNGQDSLSDIIMDAFLMFDNIELVSDFDHEDNRIFQVADMLTVIDKLCYKIKNKISFNRSEKDFFNDKKIKEIINLLKNKRFK
ncbi:MAG: hypothetical protein HFE04_01760 [Bacilli bacterium]|nr:hypothetical protein [Bacilli bacterium]